jgi:hypothetical protein
LIPPVVPTTLEQEKTTLILDAKEKEKRGKRAAPSILTRELGWRVVVVCQWRSQNGSIREKHKIYVAVCTRWRIWCVLLLTFIFFSQKLMSTKARILIKRNKREIDWFISPIPHITKHFRYGVRIGKKMRKTEKRV